MMTSTVCVDLLIWRHGQIQRYGARSNENNRAGAGVGKVKARDNQQAYGTDNEPRLRNADDPFYKKFAAECSRYQIAVDIFSFR